MDHAPIDTTVSIETPEHVVFRHRLAGPAPRSLAYGFDMVVCYGTAFGLTALVYGLLWGLQWGERHWLGGVEGGLFWKAGAGFTYVMLFAVQWVYFVAWEAFGGRTPGKRLLGLRVVTVDGRPIHFREAALRNVLRAADLLPALYGMGLASMACSPLFQRLGDRVAGTMVVAVGGVHRAAPPRPLRFTLTEAQWNALRFRNTLSTEERRAVELFLRRKEGLGEARAKELAALLADRMESRFGLRCDDPVHTLEVVYEAAQWQADRELRRPFQEEPPCPSGNPFPNPSL